MRARLLATAALLLPAVLPGSAPALDDRPDDEIVAALERRTVALTRRVGPALVCVKVTTAPLPLPRVIVPGVSVGPGGGVAEEVEGTGFLVSTSGHIATTWSLVADASHIEVRFHDGTVRDATLVGSDGPFGLAVLQADAPAGVAVLTTDPVVEPSSGTLGWFFGPLREDGAPAVQLAPLRVMVDCGYGYDRMLAAPVFLLPGAAGGPLVGREGKLIGMAIGSLREPDQGQNTRKPQATTFFVRADDVGRAAAEIVQHGRVRRGMLGVLIDPGTTRIDVIIPGSPAEAADLRENDRIVRIGVMEIADGPDVVHALLRRRAGDVVRVDVERGGEILRRELTLDELAMPPVPTTAPIPGAVVQLNAELTEDGGLSRTVTVTAVTEGLPAAEAGLREGDRVLTVDDLPVMRFLSRHRIRPSDTTPHRLRVDRAGKTVELTLPE